MTPQKKSSEVKLAGRLGHSIVPCDQPISEERFYGDILVVRLQIHLNVPFLK